MKRNISVFLSSFFALVFGATAFATEPVGIVDADTLATTIEGATGPVGTVGMAILGVLAAIMVYRLVKGLMGR